MMSSNGTSNSPKAVIKTEGEFGSTLIPVNSNKGTAFDQNLKVSVTEIMNSGNFHTPSSSYVSRPSTPLLKERKVKMPDKEKKKQTVVNPWSIPPTGPRFVKNLSPDPEKVLTKEELETKAFEDDIKQKRALFEQKKKAVRAKIDAFVRQQHHQELQRKLAEEQQEHEQFEKKVKDAMESGNLAEILRLTREWDSGVVEPKVKAPDSKQKTSSSLASPVSSVASTPKSGASSSSEGFVTQRKTTKRRERIKNAKKKELQKEKELQKKKKALPKASPKGAGSSNRKAKKRSVCGGYWKGSCGAKGGWLCEDNECKYQHYCLADVPDRSCTCKAWKPCQFWVEGYNCRKGDNCSFAHLTECPYKYKGGCAACKNGNPCLWTGMIARASVGR